MKTLKKFLALFLSLLLTLSAVAAAETVTDVDDSDDFEQTCWVDDGLYEYRTDITSIALRGGTLCYIAGSSLLYTNKATAYNSVALDLSTIIQSETLNQIGYYDQLTILTSLNHKALFSASEGRVYFLRGETDSEWWFNAESVKLDYQSVPGLGWKEFPIAPGLYDVQYEDAFYDDATNALFVIVCDDESHMVVRFDLETGKGEWVEVAESENAETYGYLFADGVLDTSEVADIDSQTTYFYSNQNLFGVNLTKGVYTEDKINLATIFTLEPIKDYDLTLGDYMTHSDYRGYVVDAAGECFYFVHDNTVWCLNANTEEVTGIAKLPFFAEDVRKALLWDDCYLLLTHDGLYSIALPDAYWMDNYLDTLMEDTAE